MKQGLINGTYHIQLSKEEVEAVYLSLRVFLDSADIKTTQQPFALTDEGKKLINTLENVVPKFTP